MVEIKQEVAEAISQRILDAMYFLCESFKVLKLSKLPLLKIFKKENDIIRSVFLKNDLCSWEE